MFRKAFRRLLAIDDPPERTALAFSIGVFIAFSPFLGLHTLLATALAFAFRLNKIAIYTGTFVNNPFLTFVPITLASYAIGAFLLDRPLALPPESMELLRHPHLLTGDYWRELVARSTDIVLPFAIGATVLSFVGAFLSYPLTLWLLRRTKVGRRKANGESEEEETEAG